MPAFAGMTLLIAAVLALPAMAIEPFRRANGNEPDTLDPQKYELASEGVILRDMFEGLTTTDADNRVTPGQAESWEVSGDGLTWTFHLREGLMWSDGAPLTAADFVAGMQREVDPRTAAKMPDMSYKIENARRILDGELPPTALGVSAPDARTRPRSSVPSGTERRTPGRSRNSGPMGTSPLSIVRSWFAYERTSPCAWSWSGPSVTPRRSMRASP